MTEPMQTECPRCGRRNQPKARFCGGCGLSLDTDRRGADAAGRVRHPQPSAVPADVVPIDDATQLYFSYESALGGTDLSGTEGLRVRVTNVGYPLIEVRLDVRGVGRDGVAVLQREYEIAALDQGETAELDVPSYDISGPLRILNVKLSGAQFAPPDDAA